MSERRKYTKQERLFMDEWFQTRGGIALFFGASLAVWLCLIFVMRVFFGPNAGFLIGHVIGLLCIVPIGCLFQKFYPPQPRDRTQ